MSVSYCPGSGSTIQPSILRPYLTMYHVFDNLSWSFRIVKTCNHILDCSISIHLFFSCLHRVYCWSILPTLWGVIHYMFVFIMSFQKMRLLMFIHKLYVFGNHSALCIRGCLTHNCLRCCTVDWSSSANMTSITFLACIFTKARAMLIGFLPTQTIKPLKELAIDADIDMGYTRAEPAF